MSQLKRASHCTHQWSLSWSSFGSSRELVLPCRTWLLLEDKTRISFASHLFPLATFFAHVSVCFCFPRTQCCFLRCICLHTSCCARSSELKEISEQPKCGKGLLDVRTDNTGQRFSINGMVRIEGKTADSYLFLFFSPSHYLSCLTLKTEGLGLTIYTWKLRVIT